MTTGFEDLELHGLGDLAAVLGGSEDSFTGVLLHLIAKADPSNRARLLLAFPRQVRAWELWMEARPTPNGGQMLALLADDDPYHIDIDLAGLPAEQAYELGRLTHAMVERAVAHARDQQGEVTNR